MNEHKQEILDTLSKSRTYREVAERHGISKQRVQQIAKEAGVSTRARRHAEIMKLLPDELLKHHTTITSVARAVGLDDATVKYNLTKAGKLTPELRKSWTKARKEAHLHGTIARYRDGCRCVTCKDAQADHCLFYLRKREGKDVDAPVALGRRKGHILFHSMLWSCNGLPATRFSLDFAP